MIKYYENIIGYICKNKKNSNINTINKFLSSIYFDRKLKH